MDPDFRRFHAMHDDLLFQPCKDCVAGVVVIVAEIVI